MYRMFGYVMHIMCNIALPHTALRRSTFISSDRHGLSCMAWEMHVRGRTSLQRAIRVSMVQHAQRLVQLGAVHMQDVDSPARIARPLVLRR